MAKEKIEIEKNEDLENKDSKSEYAIRVLRLFEKINSGGLYTKEVLREYIEEFSAKISERTLDRDLAMLQKEFNYIQKNNKGEYFIDRTYKHSGGELRINANELTSMLILKSNLKIFKNTVIADEIERLSRKLEQIVPGEIITQESVFWDQNFGQYDYTQSSPHLQKIVKYINNRTWAKIDYTTDTNPSKIMEVLFR